MTRSPLWSRSRAGRSSFRDGSSRCRRCLTEDEQDIVERLIAGIFGKNAMQVFELFELKKCEVSYWPATEVRETIVQDLRG